MRRSHSVCPVCQNKLINSIKMNRECYLLGNRKFSYIESTCSTFLKDRDHSFFQIISKDGELLFEKVGFIKSGREINVNYLDAITKITYGANSINSFSFSNIEGQVIEIKRILDLDYPDLTKVINKVKQLAILL